MAPKLKPEQNIVCQILHVQGDDHRPIEIVYTSARSANDAAEAADKVLRQYHPRILIQAYYQRDGMPTFERSARYLVEFRYQCRLSLRLVRWMPQLIITNGNLPNPKI